MRTTLRFCGVAAGALLLASCDGGERPRIAISTNLDFAAAAEMALEDARSEWGNLPADTVLAIESFTRASIAIANASELAQRGVVAVVGQSSSAASLAAAPVYNENEIVQLSPQSSATAFSDAGPYSFRLVPPDERQGGFIAQQLRALPGVERIVVLYVNDDYGRGLRSTLLASLGGGSPRVVGEAPHLERYAMRPEDLDLAQRVVAETRPDAIVWLGRPLILEQYLGSLRELGDMPIIGSDALSVVRHNDPGPQWRGVWYVDFVDLTADSTIVEFGRRYEGRFHRLMSSADALTYDATRLLLEALHDGARSGPEIRDWLNSLGRSRPAFRGITGPIQFDEDGDVSRSYVLRQFNGDTLTARRDTVTP